MANKKKAENENIRDARNEDPISGEPGAHPIGSGVGAALGGAAAGAAAGALGGPVGTVAGAIIGGVAGGLAGKAVAEQVDPTAESAYWESNYQTRPYYKDTYDYDAYEPAYRMGWSSYEDDVAWNDREPILRKSWEEQRWETEGGQPRMAWDEAKLAAEDAYVRVAEQRREARRTAEISNDRINKPR